MSMWSCYRALRPKTQVLHIGILIHIQIPSHLKDNPGSTRIHIKSQQKPLEYRIQFFLQFKKNQLK